MANEYHVTEVGAEVLDENQTAGRITVVGLEAQQTDDNATDVRVTEVGAEVQQTDNNATDIAVTLVAVEVLLSVTTTTVQEASVAFSSEFSLGVTGEVEEGDLFARVDFAFELGLGFFAQNVIAFGCDAPAFKSWTRNVPAAGSWACAVITPAEVCDPDEVTGDYLTYLDAELFEFLDGENLQFTDG